MDNFMDICDKDFLTLHVHKYVQQRSKVSSFNEAMSLDLQYLGSSALLFPFTEAGCQTCVYEGDRRYASPNGLSNWKHLIHGEIRDEDVQSVDEAFRACFVKWYLRARDNFCGFQDCTSRLNEAYLSLREFAEKSLDAISPDANAIGEAVSQLLLDGDESVASGFLSHWALWSSRLMELDCELAQFAYRLTPFLKAMPVRQANLMLGERCNPKIDEVVCDLIEKMTMIKIQVDEVKVMTRDGTHQALTFNIETLWK